LASGTPFWNIFFANVHQAPRSAAEWWRIERARIGGKSGDHPRTQRVGNIEHDIVGSPVFDEGFQLIFQILRLLAGEARDRKVAMEACAERPLCRWLSHSAPRVKRTSVAEDLSVNWIKTYMF
jgi:hypothetical protein